ncbi:hypothetical protein [uncultured Aquimarina sp.]|uniref:hypothetical protein n=1 Tax=uncultured Aquimarina sp. TaxID=575652 RepID=UPI00263A16C3|nr:hypothetical protein [uncultured Aquimarina sp.]
MNDLEKRRKKVEDWLIKNQNFIKYASFEKEINSKGDIIQKWIKYRKPFADKWIQPIELLIIKIKEL